MLYGPYNLVASPVLKSIEFSSSQSVRFISLYLWNILCLNDFPTNFETKITLNWHFFGTKPFFFYFVPKPTLFVNFSVYFDFLKFFKPKKTVGLNRRFCFRFSKMPFWDLDGFSVFCQKPTVSKLKFWIWKLQKVSVFDSNRNHLKYEIWMIH